jgi:hypothetical protein
MKYEAKCKWDTLVLMTVPLRGAYLMPKQSVVKKLETIRSISPLSAGSKDDVLLSFVSRDLFHLLFLETEV